MFQSKTLHIDCWPKCILHLGWNNTLWPFSCISKMKVQKNRFVFSLYYLLTDLLCFILLHSFHISTNFKVFPFKCYQEYAYPFFRACATGSSIWVCHFLVKKKEKGGRSLLTPASLVRKPATTPVAGSACRYSARHKEPLEREEPNNRITGFNQLIIQKQA